MTDADVDPDDSPCDPANDGRARLLFRPESELELDEPEDLPRCIRSKDSCRVGAFVSGKEIEILVRRERSRMS